MNNERYFQIIKGSDLTIEENKAGWHWCGLKIFFLSQCKERCDLCKYNPKLAGPF